jgi:peptidyl-tRNA hydrolase
MDELIQYYVVNKDLNMSAGKIAGQVAHVATIIAEDMLSKSKSEILFKEWLLKNNQKKIILRGKQKDLEKLVDQGFYYIKDIGLTEIPEGSLTCVGLGVMWKSEAQKYIKRLQLL